MTLRSLDDHNAEKQTAIHRRGASCAPWVSPWAFNALATTASVNCGSHRRLRNLLSTKKACRHIC